MLKICSFLPAVTQMIYDMGLQDHLMGVTFECPGIALKEKIPVVRCILEGKEYTSVEIDTLFSASKGEGKDLYYVDEALLAQIEPDIIFTQDVCEICQIDTECTAAAVANLNKQPEIISISPESLEDVFSSAKTIARAMGREELAIEYLNGLNHRIDTIVDTQRANRVVPKRVMLLEWMEPLYNCGHWIPHQIAFAGGIDMLSNPSGDSIATLWEKVLRYDPEVLVIAPCGFTVERTLGELTLMTQRNGWEDLLAVKNNAVFLADFDMFTQPSASTLVDGIEVMATMFHPEVFEVPTYLTHKYMHLNQFESQSNP